MEGFAEKCFVLGCGMFQIAGILVTTGGVKMKFQRV